MLRGAGRGAGTSTRISGGDGVGMEEALHAVLHPSMDPSILTGAGELCSNPCQLWKGLGFFFCFWVFFLRGCCLIHNSKTNNKPRESLSWDFPSFQSRECSQGKLQPARGKSSGGKSANLVVLLQVGWCWWTRTGKLNLGLR